MTTMDIANDLQYACRHYWTIRNSGDMGKCRTQAHDDMLSLFDMFKIPYQDRENAAIIAKDMQNGIVSLDVFVDTITSLQCRNNNETTETIQ